MSWARTWEKILCLRLPSNSTGVNGKSKTSSGRVTVAQEEEEYLKDEELEKLWDFGVDSERLKIWCMGVNVTELVEGGRVKTNISRTFISALHTFRTTYNPPSIERSRSPAPPTVSNQATNVEMKGKGKAIAVEYTEEEEERRKRNSLETMIAMFRWLLYRKSFPNFSYDVMILFSGGLDRSDVVFSDLVAAIETTLSNNQIEVHVRHRTLQLALIIVASINQGSVNAYFLRRDLFSSITHFISSPATSIYAYETFLFLGLLVNFRKYEARNPYLVRIEDLVEEDVFKKLSIVTANACLRTTEEYWEIADDGPKSYVPKLGQMFGMISGLGFVGGSGRSTGGRHTMVDIDKKGKDDMRVKEDSPFRFMPSEAAIILFPFYDLLNSNKVLASLLVSEVQTGVEEDEDDGGVLNRSWARYSPIATIISFSSYLLCHGSVSPRSRAYSRLCLIILTLFCEEGGTVLESKEYAREIRLCRQRLPTLPFSNDRKRPPMCAILDCCTLYIRHNLQKKLDVQTYVVALRLLHRNMHQLKTDRVRLDYDWGDLWRAIFTLTSFVVGQIDNLRLMYDMDELISLIFLVLGCALSWGEAFLVDADAMASLYFEMLRSEHSLQSLGDLLGSVSTNSNLPSRPTGSTVATPSRTSNIPAVECVRNVRFICQHFSEKLEQARKGKGKLKGKDANEVLEIIKLNLEGLDLVDHVGMEDVRLYSESAHEGFFRDFTRIMAQDALELLS